MALKNIICAALFCLFSLGQVVAPAFCHYSGKIHLFNSACADDAAMLLFVNDDDGEDGGVVIPLILDTFLLPVSETQLKARVFELRGFCAACRALLPGMRRLYIQYRVFRI
jgi:hypothetical protein